MKEGYIIYKCTTCNKIFILLSNDVDHSINESKYISCPYDGRHRNIIVCNRFDNMKECMENQRVYIREKGRIKQLNR